MAEIKETIGRLLLEPFIEREALKPFYRYRYGEVVEEIMDMATDRAILTMRELILDDLFFLIYYGLGRKDINQYDKPFVVNMIKEVEDGPQTDTVDLWSRGHYKSTIITQGRTIQEILRDPELTVGIFSHTRPIAKGFLLPIKYAFETSEVLKTCFPDIIWANPRKEAPVWSMDDGICVNRKSQSNTQTIEAWGLVDGMPTSKHYKLRIYDDVVTDKTVGTPEMIKKVDDAIRLSDNLGTTDGFGRQRIVGTIYSYGDYYSKVRKEADDGVYAWNIRVRPWYNTELIESSPAITEFSDEEIEELSILLPPAVIREKHKKQGPYIFACQMELDPSNEEMKSFHRKWLRYYDHIPENRNVYLLCDPANEKKKDSDYSVFAVVSIDERGNRYLEDITRDRLDLGERWQVIRSIVLKYGDIEVFYEKYGKDSDIWYFEQEQKKDGLYFDINPVGGAVSKIDRIRRLIPICSAHKFYLPTRPIIVDGKDLVKIFLEEEYDLFPFSLHDDMLDAISRIEDPQVKAEPPIASQYQQYGCTYQQDYVSSTTGY